MNEHSLNDNYLCTEQEDQKVQGNYNSDGLFDDITDVNQESQIIIVSKTFKSSEWNKLQYLYSLQDLVMKEGVHKITLSNQFYFCWVGLS